MINLVKSGISRRAFIVKGIKAGFAFTLGTDIVFADNLPPGYVPFALLTQDLNYPPGKHPDLTVLNDRPWNVETPTFLLNDNVTPADKLFIRNNGHPPRNVEPANWRLTIEGESAASTKAYTLEQLKSSFENVSYQLTIECGGNGRADFNPPASGNQWTTGAVGCPLWTGVRLKDVLEDVGVKKDAQYLGYYGADTHLSGEAGKVVISRGVPISKALEPESLIAWSINGEELPLMNGFPLRLVFGGWPASTSGKWLTKIVIRDKIHDGPKMGGKSYRVPCEPVAPGSEVPDEDMCIIESMPVKSIITRPKSGAVLSLGSMLEIGGHSWAGDLEVSEMHYSIDFGATWHACELESPRNRFAWQHWNATVTFPQKGYYEIWARATDSAGNMQPMIIPAWNPRGYLNNACHRIAVKIA